MLFRSTSRNSTTYTRPSSTRTNNASGTSQRTSSSIRLQEPITLRIPVEVHNLLLDRNLQVVPLVLLQAIAHLQEVHHRATLLVVVVAHLVVAIRVVVLQEVVAVVAHHVVVVEEAAVADKKGYSR